MEKDLPNIPPRESTEPTPDRTGGFFERWRKKVQPEQSLTETPFELADNTDSVATFALKKLFSGEERDTSKKQRSLDAPTDPIPEADEVSPPEIEPVSIAKTENLYKSTKKIGRKVLRFATALLSETEKLAPQEKTEVAEATQELDESQQHLKQELDDLETAYDSDSAVARFETANSAQVKGERAEKKESKVPAFAVAQLAVLAIAGAGIFMATLGGEHRREHRILKTHRKKAKKAIEEQGDELKLQQHTIVKQQEALTTQAAELQELKARDAETIRRKERAAFVYQVSELAEHQAEITHEVTEQLQTAKPVTQERKVGKIETLSVTAEAVAENQTRAKTQQEGQSARGAGGSDYSPILQKNATLLQKKLQDSSDTHAKKSNASPKDAWIYVAIFTTLVIASISWSVIQLLVKG